MPDERYFAAALSCSRLISSAMSMSWSYWPPMSLR